MDRTSKREDTTHNASNRFIHMMITDKVFAQYLYALTKTTSNDVLTQDRLNRCMTNGLSATALQYLGAIIWQKIKIEADFNQQVQHLQQFIHTLTHLLEENEAKDKEDESRLSPSDVDFLNTNKVEMLAAKRQINSYHDDHIKPFKDALIVDMHNLADLCLKSHINTGNIIAEHLGMAPKASTDENPNIANANQTQMTVVDSCVTIDDLVEWADRIGDKSMISDAEKLKENMESNQAQGKQSAADRRAYIKLMLQCQQAYLSSDLNKDQKSILKTVMDNKALTDTAKHISQSVWSACDAASNDLLQQIIDSSMTHEQKLAAITKSACKPELTKRINDINSTASISDKLIASHDEAANPEDCVSASSFGSRA